MSARDVIAQALEGYVIGSGWDVAIDAEQAWALADEVRTALRESRTVRTVEELDALPVGTVAMAERRVYVLGGGATVEPSRVARRYSKWRANGVVKDLDDLPLPALVLWTPDEDGA